MTRVLSPADALELSLATGGSAGVADELLALVASLRGASGAIAAPAGLRARRGGLVAGVAPRVTGPRSLTLGRRLQLALITATLALLSVVSFAAASAAISWLRDAMPPQPAPYADGTDTPSPTVAPTPEPTPSPSDLNALEQPPGRVPPEDEADDPEEAETDDEDDTEDATGDDD